MHPEDGIIAAGDLNEKVGSHRIEKTVGTFEIGEPNGNGKILIKTCACSGLKMMNTSYRHKMNHKIIWNARGQYSMIDYITANEEK